ncbi:MAG: hypothetical protein AVDCRST_MAG49-2524 [uncultured Thermomicrobiales bacterium]|uniref:Uncharacterized protein n=1 Tax=uncultured Thermomicrobiales bacterium TaxID=1645740 RepID=A0A6J4UTR5_9BACT|nr:MAG: hypothetical protein AVDCRST_MAG49-2524 [uncultured Thermomicrobiales bacterium]
METLETNARLRSARWQRGADRLARWAWPVLLAAVALALAGGVAVAAWASDTEEPEPVVDECEDPPCFGGGGLPGLSDLPVVLPVLGYGLAIALGLPSVLAGGWDLLRGRWGAGGRRLLAFVGPLLVLVGTEVVPHVISPCLPAELGAGWQPGVCERQEHGGLDVGDRWHALDHALVGAVPMAALYWLALRRWRPELALRRVV